MTCLGFIPARGGSKGVPRKNLLRIGNYTLIERAVAALKASGVVDLILLSTDDEEIAEEGRRVGAEVPFLRSAELASDTAPIIPAILSEVKRFEHLIGAQIDTLVFTEPVTPFRNATHVRGAIERFRRGDVRSVITVCPLERKPHNIFVRQPGDVLERFVRDPDVRFSRRQDMADLWRLSSGVYVVGREDLFKYQELVVEPIGYVTMTDKESVNIDSELDVLVAQVIANAEGL